MYIWPHTAIDSHMYSMNAPKRCTQYIHSAFTPRNLVSATPS